VRTALLDRVAPAVRVPRGWRSAVRSAHALRPAWAVSVLVTLVAAVGLARLAGATDARPWLLLAAPVLPLAGVAFGYGRLGDPAYELAASTPSGGLRLLLVRTGAVLAACVPLLTVAGGLLAGAGTAVAWLLPGLALTTATLTLGSWTGCRRAAVVVAAGWLAAVALCGLPATAVDVLLSGVAQPGWATAFAACAVLLTFRRTAFDHMERS
jgi:hypothetical protein